MSTASPTDIVNDFAHYIDPSTAVVPSDMVDQFPENPAFKFGIVGVGQCGNNIAATFHQVGYRRVLLLNTAKADLDSIDLPIEKLSLDKQGAGKDPDIGRQCVENKITKIRTAMSRVFDGKVDKIVVCMGLGGGTGSGGGPEIVKVAKEMIKEKGGKPERDVLVIATLPEPTLDGPRQCFNALKAYAEINRLGVPVLTVDNSQIRKVIGTTFGDNWPRMNRWVVKTLHQFNAYAAKRSDIAVFDGRDLDDVLSRGRFIFSAFRVPVLNDKYAIGNILADHLEKSLFARTKLSTAEAAACVLILNRPAVMDKSMDDVGSAFEELNNIMKPNSTLHRGIYLEDVPTAADGTPPPDLFCYVMLSGLDHPRGTLELLYEKARSFTEAEEYGSLSAFFS